MSPDSLLHTVCYRDLEEALEMGMDWSLREGYAWAEDKEHCEECGRMLQADPAKVSQRAKKRGLPQVNCNKLYLPISTHEDPPKYPLFFPLSPV